MTYFNARLKDEINGFFFDPVSFIRTANNRAGQSKRQGLEVAASLQLLENLRLQGAYTYTDATESNAAGMQRREIRRPEHIANLNLNYAFSSARANLNLNINYNGEQEDTVFLPPAFSSQTVQLRGYTLVNISASYKINRYVHLLGRVENLFDQDYEEVFGYRSQGIGAFAGVSIHYQP